MDSNGRSVAKTFRANKGVPTSNNDAIGFAFGLDGDTGMFADYSDVNLADGSTVLSFCIDGKSIFKTDRLGNLWSPLYGLLHERFASKSPDVESIASLKGTPGFYVATGPGAAAVRSLDAGPGVSILNGDGKNGNPRISLSNSGVVWGVYGIFDVDAMGRITSGRKPTKLADYGVLDAVSIDQITQATYKLQSVTPDQFDSSANTATTDWVKSFGVQFSNINQLTKSTTLTARQLKQFIQLNPGAASMIVTLPQTSSCRNGMVAGFQNTSNYPVIIMAQAGDSIATSLVMQSIVLLPGDSALLATDASGSWLLFGGTVHLAYLASDSGQFAFSDGPTGWTRFPNGFMKMWGEVSVPAGNVPFVVQLPNTYKRACRNVLAQFAGTPPPGGACGAVPTTVNSITIYQNYNTPQQIRYETSGF
ncbi:hypothetical protein JOS77_27145 [Chromobacterium haemolyticum]|nr:hypothetical protein JOS77_27145 [Chromobacterium haemolyticum]